MRWSGAAFEAPAVVAGLDDVAVVSEAIEQCGGHLGVPEDARPFAEGEIGGDDDRGAFVEPTDEMEEELAAGLGEGQIAEFIEDDEVHAGEVIGEPALPAVAGFGFKPIDEIDDIVEPTARAGANAASRNGDGEMGLAGSHAEVTGRKRRFIYKEDSKGVRRKMEDTRPASSNNVETKLFQDGKKKILVFSEAGGTGGSYHADNTVASKNARRSYLVQAGWRANKAVQGLGRTHRSNQATAPIFHLVTTDLDGQKRFISSIARRLSQLGALTKGQRQAGDQGIFSARDNLESQELSIALRQFLTDVALNRVPDIDTNDFEKQTGLALQHRSADGGLHSAAAD